MLKVQPSYGAKACNIECHCCSATAKWTVICTRAEKVFESCAEHIDDVLTIARVADRNASSSEYEEAYLTTHDNQKIPDGLYQWAVNVAAVMASMGDDYIMPKKGGDDQ